MILMEERSVGRRWRVGCVGDTRYAYKVSFRKAEKLGYLGLCKRIILQLILVLRIGLICLRIRETMQGISKHAEMNLGFP
jgi:hypothetical protein